MSTVAEKLEAQAVAFSRKNSPRHMIGPAELGTMFDRIKEQRDRIKRLEEAGDALTNCIACGCNDGGCMICRETEDNWIKAKEAKP